MKKESKELGLHVEGLEDRTMLSSLSTASTEAVGDSVLEVLADRDQTVFDRIEAKSGTNGPAMFLDEVESLGNDYQKLDLFDVDEIGLVSYSEASELRLWIDDDIVSTDVS